MSDVSLTKHSGQSKKPGIERPSCCHAVRTRWQIKARLEKSATVARALHGPLLMQPMSAYSSGQNETSHDRAVAESPEASGRDAGATTGCRADACQPNGFACQTPILRPQRITGKQRFWLAAECVAIDHGRETIRNRSSGAVPGHPATL